MIAGYEQKRNWKAALFVAALLIGISSLLYTNFLVDKLSREEQKRIQLWAAAYNEIINVEDDNNDLTFEIEVIKNNATIPVILTDAEDNIIDARNFDSLRMKEPEYLQRELAEMKEEREPIVIEYGNGSKNFIYYRNSTLVTQLMYYPYVQLFIISLFIIVSYFAFSASRKYEQNRVWVGMSKETAHQLGTPISSLLAWTEYLRENPEGVNEAMLREMEKDLERLQTITERFSKIGSAPVLEPENISATLSEMLDYLQGRVGRKVELIFKDRSRGDMMVRLSKPLFSWVIENLTKNAVDAMTGKGTITYVLHEKGKQVVLDVTDTGRGVPKHMFKTIFNPGYTTRKRGWGLGLSLAKRIIESYHRGQIYVLESEPGKGTTFRIKLHEMEEEA